MKLPYDFYKSFLLIHKDLTKENFLDLVGAKKGYSLEMFTRMFDSITSELIDVDKEYEKYYSIEYSSLEHLLYRKYNLDEDEIEKLIEVRLQNPNCILYRKDDHSYGDYGISHFTFSETMYERISKILLLKN